MKRAVAVFSVLALLTGGFFAWYASSSPDGLEWSILNVTGTTELDAPQTHIHALFSSLQDMIAPLPDYSIKGETYSENMGTTVSGIVGSIITLTFAVLMGMMFSRRKSRQ